MSQRSDSLSIELAVPAEVRTGEIVTVTMRVRNRGVRSVDLPLLGRSPTLDVIVTRATGETVWHGLIRLNRWFALGLWALMSIQFLWFGAFASAGGTALAALTGNRLLYRDGLPVAMLAAGEVAFLEELDTGEQWQARKALLRGTTHSAPLAAPPGVAE